MKRILVVEDDNGIRESLVDILEISGYEVMAATNGKEGFNQIMENTPDLVICDVNMPVLNGYELLGALNQRMENELLPSFIFLTAKIENKDIRYGMNLGADDYITKPFDHNELLSIIKMRLDKREKIINTNVKISSINTPFTEQNENTESSNGLKIDKLAIPTSEGLQFISFDHIVRCEADRSYCKIYMSDNSKTVVSKPLKEFEETLLANQFIKTHKSHIINLKYIDKYIRGINSYLVLSDQTTVPVSSRKKEEVLDLLKGF